jgi:hypothetical protein
MVAVRIREEGQNRRPSFGLSFPSPQWGEGRVRGGSRQMEIPATN